MTIEEFHNILEDTAAEIPSELFNGLNGGVVVFPESKLHKADKNGRLYIMGEYNVQIPGLGRYIALYYGSFARVFGHRFTAAGSRMRNEIAKTLRHELRHHVESLSGVRDLEIEDEHSIRAYMLETRDWRLETGD